MANILSELKDNPGARKNRIRVCRGIGSGKGKTGGRGTKGQKSRSGVAINGFEGGQMPIYRRLPKRGFNNISRQESEVLTFAKLQSFIDAKKVDAKKITREDLVTSGLVKDRCDFIKLLATGTLKSKVTIEVDAASAAAIAAIEAAGGKVILPAAPAAAAQ